MTPAEKASIQTEVKRLQKAYVETLVNGQVRVFVDQNGERIEYGAGNRALLLQYINSLLASIGECSWAPMSVSPPMGVRF